MLAGYLPKDSQHIGMWLSNTVRDALRAYEGQSCDDFLPSVKSMDVLLKTHDELHEQVSLMVKEGMLVHQIHEPKAEYSIRTIEDMLCTMNYIVQTAPKFQPEIPHSAFPMSGLFVYMMWTNAGVVVFKNKLFNQHLTAILNTWCNYLDSKDSLNVITTAADGWLSEASYIKNSLDQFVTEKQRIDDPVHWGYQSFNDFFHRQIISICRPLDGKDNPQVITSANDGTIYRIARNVKLSDNFESKSQNYSLENMLDNSPYTEKFIDGDVVQSFLSGNNYHRWWAPVSGTVIEQRVVPGYMFSELYNEGFDPSAGTKSQGYEANVNTRGLVFIQCDNPEIGVVCVIPIGITEISSINIQVRVGDKVKKGQELGWFSYGGSSMCLVFQKGAIEQFTVVNPLQNSDSDSGPFIRVGGQIAIAKQSTVNSL